MHALSEVRAALDDEELELALGKLELYARFHDHNELAAWVEAELGGRVPPDTAETLGLRYRRVGIQIHNLRAGIVSAHALILSEGINALAPYKELGCELNTSSLDPNFRCSVPSESIKALFKGVRAEAKRRLLAVLGSGAMLSTTARPTPDFGKIVSAPKLVSILTARWKEAEETSRAGAYLSTIIMLGSVLEGTLLDRVEREPETANRSICAPKDRKTGTVLPFGHWKLASLIEVAHSVGWIDKDVSDFSFALRDYRNFVHPNEQRQQGFSPDRDTCEVAWAVMVAALGDLAK
jgi:hypothetical protein